jgi:hypothetical protein
MDLLEQTAPERQQSSAEVSGAPTHGRYATSKATCEALVQELPESIRSIFSEPVSANAADSKSFIDQVKSVLAPFRES